MNHLLVDFENVHQVDLTLMGEGELSFKLMVGAKQTKLDRDLVGQLMVQASSAQLVKLKSNGRNALDFTLASYMGRAALADPTAHFHIIAKDGGFAPRIELLLAGTSKCIAMKAAPASASPDEGKNRRGFNRSRKDRGQKRGEAEGGREGGANRGGKNKRRGGRRLGVADPYGFYRSPQKAPGEEKKETHRHDRQLDPSARRWA